LNFNRIISVQGGVFSLDIAEAASNRHPVLADGVVHTWNFCAPSDWEYFR